jgi:hypothetical protein
MLSLLVLIGREIRGSCNADRRQADKGDDELADGDVFHSFSLRRRLILIPVVT